MPPTDRIQECAALALRDVAATTGLRVHVSPWHGRDTSIGWVVHERGVHPRRPVWEAFQLLGTGDAIALHHVGPENTPFFGDNDDADVVDQIARGVQDLVQFVLWQQGADPTWPPCPAHHGRHPLWTGSRSMTWSEVDGQPVVEHDTGAVWVCREAAAAVRMGEL